MPEQMMLDGFDTFVAGCEGESPIPSRVPGR